VFEYRRTPFIRNLILNHACHARTDGSESVMRLRSFSRCSPSSMERNSVCRVPCGTWLQP
jgi:hypothetical protein